MPAQPVLHLGARSDQVLPVIHQQPDLAIGPSKVVQCVGVVPLVMPSRCLVRLAILCRHTSAATLLASAGPST